MKIEIPSAQVPFTKDGKDYVVGFNNNDFLQSLKTYMNHPYTVSKVQIEDLLFYLKEKDNNLMLISNHNCDVDAKKSRYTMSTIEVNDINNDAECIPVGIHKMSFN
jgi:hypothetical protein